MSVASEITRIEQAKQAIKVAINGKGGNLTDDSKLDGFADAIDNLPSGECGGDDETLSKLIDGSLERITIPNGITNIRDYAFQRCTSLTSVTILNSVTNIGNYAFSNCERLTSITIPNSVTNIGNYAFFHCERLTSITIPNSVKKIGTDTFNSCSSLETIELPTNLTSIPGQAFQNCKSLTSITIPQSVTNISINAFKGCSSLETIELPRNIKSIGNYTFQNCTSLTSITIPQSVTSISTNAFSGCTAMNLVYYDCNAPLTANVFKAPPVGQLTFVIRYTGGVIKYVTNALQNQTKTVVPKSLFNTYRSDSTWSTMRDYIYWVDDDNYYPGCVLRQTDPDEEVPESTDAE